MSDLRLACFRKQGYGSASEGSDTIFYSNLQNAPFEIYIKLWERLEVKNMIYFINKINNYTTPLQFLPKSLSKTVITSWACSCTCCCYWVMMAWSFCRSSCLWVSASNCLASIWSFPRAKFMCCSFFLEESYSITSIERLFFCPPSSPHFLLCVVPSFSIAFFQPSSDLSV